jgi:putative membrane protein
MYEVTAGEIAETRAQSPAVKDFARQMVEAHKGTSSQLKSLIASHNINVTPPAHVDSRRQGLLDSLRGAKAADFDHRYMSQQVAAHKEADILMREYAEEGDNAAIKDFARVTDKAVKMHLSMARKLEHNTETASNR